MERRPIPASFDKDQKRYLEEILDESLGDLIDLESDPTTAANQLKPNQIGFNPTTVKLFINISGTTYSVLLTAV